MGHEAHPSPRTKHIKSIRIGGHSARWVVDRVSVGASLLELVGRVSADVMVSRALTDAAHPAKSSHVAVYHGSALGPCAPCMHVTSAMGRLSIYLPRLSFFLGAGAILPCIFIF